MASISINERLIPDKAIVLFKKENEYNPSYYLEQYDIEKGKLCNGTAVDESMLSGVLKSIVTDKEKKKILNSTFIERKILGMNFSSWDFKLCWYRPPMKTNMNYTGVLEEIPSGTMMTPGLVIMAKKSSVMMFAVKEYPNEETTLFLPPFHNLMSDSFCLGTTKKTKMNGDVNQYMIELENNFFLSAFSHGASATKGNMNELHRELITSGKNFPLKELRPSKKKLKDIL